MMLRFLNAGILALLLAVSITAADLRLTGIVREPNGDVRVTHSSTVDFYYLLLRGDRLESILTVRSAALGVNGEGVLLDGATTSQAAYYRAMEISLDAPLDSDGDGIDDVYELRTAGLDPLNPADAHLPAPGAGGRTYLEVYQEQQVPLTTLASTSPFAGEDGVSVTRETVFRFTRPLAPDTTLTTTNVFATYGGRKLLSRVELASDRRSLTLFPLENLPGSARVRVTIDPGIARDDLGRLLDLAGNGVPASPSMVDFDTISLTPVGETAVIGQVFASTQVLVNGVLTNLPLSNVIITVDGAEESLRTTTDEAGQFKLQPAPAGRFFVHVDGRTSTTGIGEPARPWYEREYYPVVGKAWETVAGVTTNLPNETGIIYLPLIPAGALQAVSATEETVISFPPSVIAENPGFAGVSVRVPANALYDDNGQRGGRVGLAPVAPDRLPEPLPAGLEHVLDITVQSDGPRNFSEPVPVRFPNLPSPSTGERLPAGAQTALVSFNHDLGRWEVVGTMTVSSDGQFLDSDPGVGVRQPGWHGWQRLTWAYPWTTVVYPPLPFEWLPIPPGPFPPPFPQPPGPDFPDPLPPGPWPDFPPWPDDGPEPPPRLPNPDDPDAPPFPDWPVWPDEPPGDPDDGPDWPPGGGGGGGGGDDTDPGGVSSGPYCLEPAIETGCENSGVAVPGAGTAGISSDGGSAFQLTYSQSQGTVTAEVRARSNGRLVFATQVNPIRPPNSVGFGPAAQAFVHVFRQATGSGLSGDEVVQLVTLRESQQNHVASRTITLGSSYLNASSVRFSPHGRYLIYTALKTDGQIALLVIDVVTRETVFQGSFPYSTAPVLVPPDEMVQFGPDCADRSMVFHFGDTPTTLAWHLVNLETRRLVALRRVTPGSGSWAFSSCGDAIQLDPGPVEPTAFLATADGRTLTELDATTGEFSPSRRVRPNAEAPPATQTAPRPRYSRGLHFYVLIDMLSGRVVQRGRSGASGVLLEGVLLAPNRPFRVLAVRASDLAAGRADFISGNVGQGFLPPSPILGPDPSADADQEGLTDFAEFILGTDPSRPDTNGDGITDAAAVRAGRDPLEGGASATGIIGAVPLPGAAVDICAVGDRVILALGSAGVAVLQHPPGRSPTVIALVDTAGNARRAACSGDLVALADGPAGLTVVDIADPPAARIVHRVGLGNANAVTVASGIAFAGTQEGQVVMVELSTGTELGRISVGGAVQDLQFAGDRLYVLSDRRLLSFRLEQDELIPGGVAVTSGSGNPANRVFLGGGLAYLTHLDGYRVFDLSNPDAPVELTSGSDTQVGWQQLVANGSGLGLAAAGPTFAANNEVQVYDVSDPTRNTQFLTRYVTPTPVNSVAIHLGLGYLATSGGLQVLNYQSADVSTNPPTLSLAATFPLNPAKVESGRLVAITANAADDVQVREVEFYLDEVRVAADGGFPFEYAFFAPTLTAERTSFRFRARAFDTAGNSRWSEELVVTLSPDVTPPRARPAAPAANGFAASPARVSVLFNEPIDPATLTADRLQLVWLGPDRQSGSLDDLAVLESEVTYDDQRRVGALEFAALAEAGRYRATLQPGVADRSGNTMTNDLVWYFEVVIGADTDGDGLTDDYERSQNLDPLRADQNGNGIPDAQDDFDTDGLNNGTEMMLGTSVSQPRTFDDILDSELDRDGDFLKDVLELGLGTDFLRANTDGDRWNDEIEVTTGADPLVPNVYLPGLLMGRNAGHALRPTGSQFRSAQSDVLRLGEGQVIQVTSQVDVLRQGGPNELGHTVNLAQPSVRVGIEPEDELPSADPFFPDQSSVVSPDQVDPIPH